MHFPFHLFISWFVSASNVLTDLSLAINLARLEGERSRRKHWYVQNVSTFPNTFDVVSPLIYVFWIQLTWTNAVFSRIALVSCFCAEIQLSGKIPKNTAKILFYQKTHGGRIRDGEELGGRHTTWWRGPSLAVPGGGEAASAIASTPPSAYIYPLTRDKLDKCPKLRT
jgi:hypothetical protein